MHIAILHNRDHDLLEDDPGREAREDVTRVAAALCDALDRKGQSAEPVVIENDSLEFISTLKKRKPALVVNLCESLAADSRGEMAVSCLLELSGIPFTGSSALSLGLALHKHKAKEILLARGVPTPAFYTVDRLGDLTTFALPFPVIVKPSREDASVGIDFDSVVWNREDLTRVVGCILTTFKQPALVEQFISGREVYVPLLGNSPRLSLPLSEIRFGGETFKTQPHVVSYRAKWAPESAECLDSPSVRCMLTPELEERVVRAALAAFDALECRDYGRVDLRVTPAGEPYVIDINPNCDLHPGAGFAKAAAVAGIDYAALAQRLVHIALERINGNPSHRSVRPGVARRPVAESRNILAGRSGGRAGAHRPRVQAE